MSFSVPGMSNLLSFIPNALADSAYYDELILDSVNRASFTIQEDTNPPGLGTIKTLTLAYNPESLSISRSVKWSSSDTDGNNSQQAFAGGGEDTMDVPVLLDGSEWEVTGGGSVLTYIEYLHALATPYIVVKGEGEAKDIRPPIVSLKLADLVFVGVVTSLKTNIEMFTAEGNPMRAVVTVSLKGLFAPSSESKGKDLILAPKAKPDKGKGGSAPSGDLTEEQSE
ncbi:MAG: phage protein U [Myxococcota bacterium]|jgi:phage protein U